MRLKHGWLIVLPIVALVAAACGPETVTPSAALRASSTPADQAAATSSPTAIRDTELTPEAVSTAGPLSDTDDWRVLGAPDAPVTIVEYSDFQ